MNSKGVLEQEFLWFSISEAIEKNFLTKFNYFWVAFDSKSEPRIQAAASLIGAKEEFLVAPIRTRKPPHARAFKKSENQITREERR